MSKWQDHLDISINYPSDVFVALLAEVRQTLPPGDPFHSVVSETLDWASPMVHPRIKFLFTQNKGVPELLVAVAINKSHPGFYKIFFMANDLAIAMNPQRWFHLTHDALTQQPERLVVVANILDQLSEVLEGYTFPTPAEFRSFIEGLDIPDEEFDTEPYISSDDTDDHFLQ